MLTKNFFAYMGTVFQYVGREVTLIDGTSKTLDAYAVDDAFDYAPFRVMNSYGEANSYGVKFGSGTAKPTPGDFVLNEPITGLTVIVPNGVSFSNTDDGCELSVTFGVTASEAVTISEIGLFAGADTVSTSGKTWCYFMVDRTLLETPVTLAAGESKQITYTIRFNYPSA